MKSRQFYCVFLLVMWVFSPFRSAYAIQSTPAKEEIQRHWDRVFSNCKKFTKCTLESSTSRNGEIVHRERQILALSGKKRMSSTNRYGGELEDAPFGILRIYNGEVDVFAGAGQEFTDPESSVSWAISSMDKSGEMDYRMEGWYALPKFAGVMVTHFVPLGYFDLNSDHVEVTEITSTIVDGRSLVHLTFVNRFENVNTKIYNASGIVKGTFWLDPEFDYLPVRTEVIIKDGSILKDRFEYQGLDDSFFLDQCSTSMVDKTGSRADFTTKVTLVTDDPVPDRMFELETYGLIRPKRRSESWINSWSLILFGIVLVSGAAFYQWRNRS